uniref:PA domain-containing protein n=1 Tax=Eucampia antarctica TaxID=49252 RepID=A0A7S2S2U1_9STRA|mmetsp:Transcript_30217/g.29102  ORF Transcript_30217/g.29102 Transcript_30217/m.29102 type:complete len:518 (+) Transcript_30217:58-1611(+)
MTPKFYNIQALLTIVAAASLLIGINALGDGVTSKLKVHVPTGLSKAGGYEHREALFGVPPYGGAIIEKVYFADDRMCDDKYDAFGGYPERENDANGNDVPWQTPFILMIERGGCTFVQKVRNAQRAGAAAVIIADMLCQCKYDDLCHSEPNVECEGLEPTMADDGSGADISIPSFLMFKQDADPVKATLMSNNPVRMELRWSVPNPGPSVSYELWTTPTDTISEEFQLDFKEAALALGGTSSFTPHMFIYDGYISGCFSGSGGGENVCDNLCTNNGRYCATDPDGDLDTGVSGSDVVRESLRRLCIWDQYGGDGIGKEWWDYVDYFINSCISEFFTDRECIMDAMQQSNIDIGAVEQCMSDSGGLEEDKINARLALEIKAKEDDGVVILPVAYVNGAAIRGALEFSTMFKAVCSGYKSGTQPEICDRCSLCPHEKECVERGYCTALPGSKAVVSKSYFMWSIVVIIVSFAGIAFAGYTYHQKRMRSQIRGILAEYMPIDKEGNLHDTAIDADDAEFS